MKRTLYVALLILLALFAVGCQVVSGGNYVLSSGQTVSGDLLVLGGNSTLEPGSRVTGSLVVVGGNTDANGRIDGDVPLIGGNLNFGPGAVVRGAVQKVGGDLRIASGAAVRSTEAQVAGNVARVIGNLVALFFIFPLLLVFIVIVLVVTRSTSGAAPAASGTSAAPAAASDAAPAPTLVSGAAGQGTGLSGNIVLAVILIGLGLLFLLQELVNVDIWGYGWPFLVLAAGILFFVAMLLGGRNAARLAVPGSILTVAGLILLYQNAFDQFQTWAYAWALIFPTSIGIGHLVEGLWGDRADLSQKGVQETTTGLIIFVILGAFFELVINLSGFYQGDLSRFAFPALLILVGVLLLFGRLIHWPGTRTASR